MINATSKNTGIAIIKPEIAKAEGALSIPNFRIMKFTIAF